MTATTIKQSKMRRIGREALSLTLLITGILAARSTLADHYNVPTGSMEHTLIAGDHVFVDKRAYGFRLPFTKRKLTEGSPVGRGDVVIFDSPRDGTRLIKRIVAIGGDQVRLENGQLTINGRPLRQPGDIYTERFGDKRVRVKLESGGGPELSMIVDEGSVLAIGDHRGNSLDSRVFGTVPEEEVYGRAVAIYYRRASGFGWLEL